MSLVNKSTTKTSTKRFLSFQSDYLIFNYFSLVTAMADSRITDLDLYEMLGLEMSATTGEVSTFLVNLVPHHHLSSFDLPIFFDIFLLKTIGAYLYTFKRLGCRLQAKEKLYT